LKKRGLIGKVAQMQSSTMKPVALAKAQAKRIWLRAQRLDTHSPFGAGPEATTAAVAHLGYVQIDTIHIITFSTRAFRSIGVSICARRKASTRRCSSIGRMRCRMCRRGIFDSTFAT
jgi:hypothetical protein